MESAALTRCQLASNTAASYLHVATQHFVPLQCRALKACALVTVRSGAPAHVTRLLSYKL